MALRSELQFWTGPLGTPTNVWKTATNLGFNAVTSLNITDDLSNPKVLELRLNNAAQAPLGTEANLQVGPFSIGQTDALVEFQRVRIFHPDTGNILFYGKIYRLENIYDPSYGDILKITAYDNLKELVDYPTDDKDVPFVLKHKLRSTLLKEILNHVPTVGLRHESTLAIPTTNIDSDPPGNNLFENSVKVVRNQDGEGTISLNTGSKKALGVILSISQLDPHSSQPEEDDFGYDFYVSDRFNLATSTGNHIPGQDFNYFKRGSRPATLESDVDDYKGLYLEYANDDFPILGSPDPDDDVPETGLHRLMLPQYSFERDSQEIYTEGLINTSEQVASDTENGEQTREVRAHLRVELLAVNFGSSPAQTFQWEGKALDAREKLSLSEGKVAEEIGIEHTHGGNHTHIIGRIQWQDKKIGEGHILVSYQVGSAHFENMDEYITGSAILTLVGQQTGKTCTIVPSSGRYSKRYSIRRAYRVKRDTQSGGDGLRREVFNALTKGKVQTIRGNLRMIDTPITYLDTTGTVNSATQVTLAITPADYDFKLGMTIAKIDSAGAVTAYGYASTISGDAVVATLNTGDWTSYSGTIRLYMPIRAGHYLYASNQTQHVAGYQFINEVLYSEGEGMVVTNFKTQGTQPTFPYSVTGLGLKPNAITSKVDETVAPIGALTDNIMKTGLPWTFIPNHATDRGIESTDYNTITIRAGVFQLANGLFSYNILAHTRDITTADHIIYFAPDISTTVFQFVLKANYVPDNDHISIGWCRAVANTNGNEKAILEFNSSGVIGADPMHDGGFIAPSTINTTQIANNSITAAILKASSRPWTSNIKFTGTAWDAVQWNDGAQSPGNATLTFANSEAVTITAGSQGSLAAGATYYAYIDGVTGTQAMETLSSTYTDAIGDAKILLAIVTVGANANDGAKPAIFPFNSKAPTINAVVIAADAIQTDHMQAGTIHGDRITGGTIVANQISAATISTIQGGVSAADVGLENVANQRQITTFYQTSPPNALAIGDLWYDTDDDNKSYRASQLGTSNWQATTVGKDGIGLGNVANERQVNTFRTTEPPNATAIGDMWIDTNDGNKSYRANATGTGGWEPITVSKAGVGLGNVANERQITTFRTDDPPSALAVGDIWVDTNNNNTMYRASATGVGGWEPYTVEKAGIGLGLVDNLGAATIRAGTTATDVGLSNVSNVTTDQIRSGVLPTHVTDNMDGVTMSITGNIYSGSKTTYASNTAGWFIGFNSGTPVMNFGSGSSRLRWTGTDLLVEGTLTGSIGNFGSVTLNASGLNIGTDIIMNSSGLQISGADNGALKFSAGNAGSTIHGRLRIDPNNNDTFLWQDADKMDMNGIVIQNAGSFQTANSTFVKMPAGTSSSSTTVGVRTGGSGTVGSPYTVAWRDLTGVFSLYGDTSHGPHISGEYNQDSFKYIDINNTDTNYSWGTATTTADNDTDTLYLVAGSGIELRSDTSSDAIRITSSGGHTHSSSYAFSTGAITTGDIIVGGAIYNENDLNTYIALTSDHIKLYGGGQLNGDFFGTTSYAFAGIAGAYVSSYNLKVHGTAVKLTAGDWAGYSDDRIKENVASITNATTLLKSLNPITYTYTDEWHEAHPSLEEKTYHGFLASEFEAVIPNQVITTKEDLVRLADGSHVSGEYSPKVTEKDALPEGATIVTENIKAVDASLTAYLVAAIKELEARIAALESA